MLESFITILYDFEIHSDYVALLERPLFVPQYFIYLIREKDETF